MAGLLIDTEIREVRRFELIDEIEDDMNRGRLLREINCEFLETEDFHVGNVNFLFVFNKYAQEQKQPLSCINLKKNISIFGSVFICSHNEFGYIRSIDESDFELLKSKIIYKDANGLKYPVLVINE